VYGTVLSASSRSGGGSGYAIGTVETHVTCRVSTVHVLSVCARDPEVTLGNIVSGPSLHDALLDVVPFGHPPYYVFL
jgi:hypothetical protein